MLSLHVQFMKSFFHFLTHFRVSKSSMCGCSSGVSHRSFSIWIAFVRRSLSSSLTGGRPDDGAGVEPWVEVDACGVGGAELGWSRSVKHQKILCRKSW